MLRLLTRRRFAAACAALTLLAPTAGRAETPVITAPQAQAMMQDGKLVVLDIRSRAEWKETGLAKGAWPVSMHEQDFGSKLNAILAKYKPDQIALICATGGRSEYVVGILEKNGVAGITDISEGMIGNGKSPGWIKRGLPLTPLDQAQADYNAAISGN